MELEKRFSIAHFDSWPGDLTYYEAISNSSPEFRREIHDIYFGKIFRCNYREQEQWDDRQKLHEVTYGNVMGVEATDAQVAQLFRIQSEFGIQVSLTINQLNVPVEIFYSRGDRVARDFIEWLGGYYDRGLRSCTLANNHLMRTGMLRKMFPEMTWKNTVNQQVTTAQQVIDYLYLGYDTIQLDRSLNRNLGELRRIRRAVETFRLKHPERNVRTCMLVWEDCLPSCPFKREHDDLQPYHRRVNYWKSGPGAGTCSRWRDSATGKSLLPRAGNNCYWVTQQTFQEYAALVDVFKFSGRLTEYTPLSGDGKLQFGWSARNNAVSSFGEILNHSLLPVSAWSLGAFKMAPFERNPEKIRRDLSGSLWLTDAGLKLEEKLTTCRSQCLECHLCERTFGMPDIDSLVAI
ncbi:hypothetical protein DEALK_11230 [Dehalogenimonas alkenigignens]|uniref:Uncharacterized protein n=1 Tax=Dehalogenimonas alkenigignens TaxID=1217799 RepID=A0A0W0GI97_9CHLR|nr:hypothetical protein [Dehalogenimonas alkenigignens]KTB48278.1 hypothetical protein DEALK_11230 [Dehalogenimonas alkenigignens]